MGANIDLEIAIELTDGLSVDEDPNAVPAREISYAYFDADAPPPSYSDGVITFGTRNQDERIHSLTSATIPVRVSSTAVVNEQCLTATISGNSPPPGAGPFNDDITDNVVRLCLGEPSEEDVFQDGTVAVWTLHACRSNVPENACDTAAEVDVRVLTSIDGNTHHVVPVIHVQDDPGRVFDADNGSVTDGSTVSWQTATDEDPDFTGTRNGVQVGFVRSQINNYLQNWNHFQVTYTASGLNGADPPGKISVRSSTSGTALWALTSDNSWTFKRSTEYSLSTASTATQVRMVEFEKLGTYLLDYTADLTHATLTSPDVFSGTGRTIFHVGPIAEFGVSDGGPSGDATADQIAFTVVGINNQHEDDENGKIVVELPSGTTGLATVPAGTGDFDGNASPPTWTWDIHDLELAGRRASKGLPEGEIVTLIVDGVTAGETAIGNVVYDPYEVCVASDGTTATATTETACTAITGASWHSGTVFDYNDDNDLATLTARVGGGAPGTPTVQSTSVYMPAVGFEWDETDYIYGFPVKHYETEWSADGTSEWMELKDKIPATEHIDTDFELGQTKYYRVRAVNEAGVPGPWSAPMSVMVEEEVMATAGAPDAPVLTAVPNEPNGRTEILITWSKPVENGSPITSYTLQVSDNGRDPWTDVSPQPGVADESYVYSDGLTGGTRKYFRMLATNMCDGSDPAIECDSLWSDVVDVTTRAPGISSAPTGVSAVPDGDSAIDVSWDAPAGRRRHAHHPLRGAVVGRRVGGWNNAGSTPDGTTLTLKNTGMTFGTTRYYRVAARNARGLSAWSDPPYASATTLSGVPGQPSLTVSATDANTIALTWTVPADNGDPITGYEIQWSADGSVGSWIDLTNPSATATSYDDTPLSPGTERHYQIRAVNSTGERLVVHGAQRDDSAGRARRAHQRAGRGQRRERHRHHLGTALRRRRRGRHRLRTARVRRQRHHLLPADQPVGVGALLHPQRAATRGRPALQAACAQPGRPGQLLGGRLCQHAERRAHRAQPHRPGQRLHGDQALLDQARRQGLRDTALRAGGVGRRQRLEFPVIQHLQTTTPSTSTTGLSGGTTKHYRIRAVNANGAWAVVRDPQRAHRRRRARRAGC